MSKDSKRFPERRKTRNYRRIIADVSQILRRDSPMHLRFKKYRRMFGDCSANIPRLVADHRRIFAEHFSRQNIVNGSRKISKQALKILGIGEMLPHEYHEFRLFAEGSIIPPEHRLMLVNFHRDCIGDAKKAQWDRGIKSCHLTPLKHSKRKGLAMVRITKITRHRDVPTKEHICLYICTQI